MSYEAPDDLPRDELPSSYQEEDIDDAVAAFPDIVDPLVDYVADEGGERIVHRNGRTGREKKYLVGSDTAGGSDKCLMAYSVVQNGRGMTVRLVPLGGKGHRETPSEAYPSVGRVEEALDAVFGERAVDTRVSGTEEGEQWVKTWDIHPAVVKDTG